MAKKKKDPTAFELALDAIRAPMRLLDDSIRLWDMNAKIPSIEGLNEKTRICSVLSLIDSDTARSMAEQIMNHYKDRFVLCVIETYNSAHDDKPLGTRFIFGKIPVRTGIFDTRGL